MENKNTTQLKHLNSRKYLLLWQRSIEKWWEQVRMFFLGIFQSFQMSVDEPIMKKRHWPVRGFVLEIQLFGLSEIWEHLPKLNVGRGDMFLGPVKLKNPRSDGNENVIWHVVCSQTSTSLMHRCILSFELITCQCINAAVTRSLEGARKSHSVDIGTKYTIQYNLHYPLSTAHFCLQTHAKTAMYTWADAFMYDQR